jgi:hypothetical protein
MTLQRNLTVWELRRQGFHELAWEAEARWNSGELFTPDHHTRLSLRLKQLVQQCNRDAAAVSPSNRAAETP